MFQGLYAEKMIFKNEPEKVSADRPQLLCDNLFSLCFMIEKELKSYGEEALPSNTQRRSGHFFYERGRTFAKTRAKYGMAKSIFFEWKKKFDKHHPLPDAAAGGGNATRKARLHLEKQALEWEVMRQCPCGVNALVNAEIDSIDALSGKHSIHVL